MNRESAEKALALYDAKSKLENELKTIELGTEFHISFDKGWAKAPIDSDEAINYMNRYYHSKIDNINKELIGLGFTP